MEKKTYIRCVCNIHYSMDLPMKMVSTDRHVSIKKLMRMDERFKHIEQPSRGVLRKRYSGNMQQICNRTPMPKCDFNNVAK